MKRCQGKDCLRDATRRGLCGKHYARWWRHGDAEFKVHCQPPRRATPEYIAWLDMKQRCANPKNASYPNYGGRGIRVCARWMHSFDNFLVDIGSRPPGHSLDRIDNDGDYEPGNCKWSTKQEQNRNRRPRSRTGHNGVYYRASRGKYVAVVTINGKSHHLGTYATADEAAKQRAVKLKRLLQSLPV